MRKIFSFFLIAFISIVGLPAQQTSRIVYFANIIGLDINTEEEIPDRNLSIIYFILDNTQEQHIHCMRGEDHNQVFILPDGRVMVFDKQHHEVTNFNTRGNPFTWQEKASWEDMLSKAKSMIIQYLDSGKHARKLKMLDAVACGLVEGNLEILYKKR